MARGWRKYADYNWVSFGRWVKQSRTTLGWPLETLSVDAGLNNRGTLKQVEDGTRGLDPDKRARLIERLSGGLEDSGHRIDRPRVLRLAGIVAPALQVPPDDSQQRSVTRRHSNQSREKITYRVLDVLERRISILEDHLYRGKAKAVMEEAHNWYFGLLDDDSPVNDPLVNSVQVRLGILLGRAQEAVLPWYQRGAEALRTYQDVEARFFGQSLSKTLSPEYPHLIALQLMLYREFHLFDRCGQPYEQGLEMSRRLGDVQTQSALMRNHAHGLAIQGDERGWRLAFDDIWQVVGTSSVVYRDDLLYLGKSLEADGYRRLAFNPRLPLSLAQRRKYAESGLAAYAEASRLRQGSWTRNEHLTLDGHPLIAAFGETQCLVWLDPAEALSRLDLLRSKSVELLPSLSTKIMNIQGFARQLTQWKRHDPIPAFDLDAQYRTIRSLDVVS